MLAGLRAHSWRVRAEKTRTLHDSLRRPDILIEQATQWPVVIEAELTKHPSAEQDTRERLGQIVNKTGKPIESAIALVYPGSVLDLREQALRDDRRRPDRLEYERCTLTISSGEERLPEWSWLRRSARDLAMLAHRASMPAPGIEDLGQKQEHGIENAASCFTERHGSHSPGELGLEIASLLGQADDQRGQTRRVAMTVLINALSFDEALAEGRFPIEREELSPPLPPSGQKLPQAEEGPPAAAHPGVPFDSECLLTMAYGGDSAWIGSLELLAEHVRPT